MTLKNRLFVGSLPYNYTESELLKLFVTEGKVIDVRIIKNPWGRSRGMGYVQFELEEDALKAKEKYHNWHLGELKIIVDFAKEDPALGPNAKKSVPNLPKETEKNDLIPLYQRGKPEGREI
jgi:RNA recognition motif-containing protein